MIAGGNIRTVLKGDLSRKKTRSCGCLKRELISKKMFNFITKYFKKKKSNFTGFEVKLWANGKLLTHAVSSLDQIYTYQFPSSSFLKTSKDTFLTGYNIVPHLETY